MTRTPSPTRRALIGAGLCSVVTLAGCGEGLRGLASTGRWWRFGGSTMGTTYTVKAGAGGLDDAALARARDAVERAFAEVVSRMSPYDPDSELSRFNRSRSTTPFELTADTATVLAVAREVSEASGGAFDVTVAPAVDLWGFGPHGRHRVPAIDEIARARASIGYRGLRADARAGLAVKSRPDVAADLSGIAKGFGVDRAASALDALGIADYMIEVGGEIRTRGRNADGHPWRIAIELPDALPRRAHLVVPLSGLSMATSGDYRIFFEENGIRHSHEIDPARGAPVRHRLASVSVVAGDCTQADAWSTGLFVAGPLAGFRMAEALGLAAYFIVRRPDGGLDGRASARFAALHARASG